MTPLGQRENLKRVRMFSNHIHYKFRGSNIFLKREIITSLIIECLIFGYLKRILKRKECEEEFNKFWDI